MNGSMHALVTISALHCAGLAAAEIRDSQAASRPAYARPALEEIVVTASRREERLQDVPLSITVLSAEQLDRRRIEDVDALQFAAPNMAVTAQQTNRTAATIAMRGHVEMDGVPSVDPAVGLYLDGVYIARATGANLRLFDVARVEVLRGPQGTLFGRNTIGGAIQIVPREPALHFEASVSAGAGNFGRREAAAIVNLPQSDGNSALRLSLAHSEHGGYARSTLLDREMADDDTDYARAQVSIRPREGWELKLSFDYTRTRTGSQWLTLLTTHPLSAAIPEILGNPDDSLARYVDPSARNLPVNRAGATKSTVGGASATLTASLAHATFKSITAFRGLEVDAWDSDQDATPYDIAAIRQRRDRQQQLSEELQLYGTALGGRMHWIGGLLYFAERALYTQRFPLLGPPAFDPVEAIPWGRVDNDSIAAYAQTTYSLTPRVRLTTGIRFNQDARQLTSRNTLQRFDTVLCRLDPAVLDVQGICEATLPERRFSYVPYSIGLDFRPGPAALFYARMSRGHRAGGYNMRGASIYDLDVFGPERVTAYEIGSNADLFDNRLKLSMALYRSNFADIQLLQTEVLPGDAAAPFTVRLVRNGGEARLQGGELAATALVGPLTLSATWGITDAKYVRVSPLAADITLQSDFLMTPRATGSLAADLAVPIRVGALNFHADYSWREDVAFAYDPQSIARQEAYGLLNAQIAARIDAANLELRVWGRNLTDTHYLVRAFDGDLLAVGMPGEPRTYGVSLTYRFGQ